MLGYFALYSGPLARHIAAPGATTPEPRSAFGLLPHEIAALDRD